MPKYLQALTVCVNYSDILRWILPNKRHFDRWLVVTHKTDKRTLDLCRKHGIETLCSKRLYEKRAKFNKAKALNEGLDALAPGEWTVVLDSDILLSRNFRELLDVEALNWRALYGLTGRRICLSVESLELLKDRGPWTRVAHSSTILGYFQLFHLSQSRNRFPETSDDASSYDMVFADSFPANLRKRLPMTCLHLGPVKQNWQGRKTARFHKRRTADGYTQLRFANFESIRGACIACFGTDGRGKRVAQVGYQNPDMTNLLCEQFGEVSLIDCWGIDFFFPGDEHAAMLSERKSHFWSHLQSPEKVTLAGPCEERTLKAVSSECVDAIFFDGEFTSDAMLEIAAKLKPGLQSDELLVFGWGYDIEFLSDSATEITAAFGMPEWVANDSTWAIRLLREANETTPGEECERGILLHCADVSEFEAALMTICTIKTHTAWPICLIYSGEESSTISCYARRLGVRFHQFSFSGGGPEMRRLRALKFSPFKTTVYVANGKIPTNELLTRLVEKAAAEGLGMLVESSSPDRSVLVGDLFIVAEHRFRRINRQTLIAAATKSWIPRSDYFAYSTESNSDSKSATTRMESIANYVRVLEGNKLQRPLEIALALHLSEEPGSSLEFEDYSVINSHSKSDYTRKAAIWASLRAKIRSPENVSIVTVVVPENLEVFSKVAPSWVFGGRNDLHFFAVNVSAVDLEFLKDRERTFVHFVETRSTAGAESVASEALIRGIGNLDLGSSFIYVNAGCFPGAGAEIFASAEWQSFGAVGCGWLDRTAPVPDFASENPFMSPFQSFPVLEILNGIGIIQTDVLREANRILEEGWHAPDFDRLISMAAHFKGSKMTAVARVARWGWTNL